MIGRKLYYELATGDPILDTGEKHNDNATNTTKEQDFEMYDVLSVRSPDAVGLLHLEYGEKRDDFRAARSWKVDPETLEIYFDFPARERSHGEQIRTLKAENERKTQELQMKDQQIGQLLIDVAKEKRDRTTLQQQVGSIMLKMAKNNIN